MSGTPHVLLVMATRDPAETHDEFMAWWHNHAATAAKIPGIVSYRVFRCSGGLEREAEWDGFSLIEFEPGLDAPNLLFQSPEGKAAMAETKGRGGRRFILGSDSVHQVV